MVSPECSNGIYHRLLNQSLQLFLLLVIQKPVEEDERNLVYVAMSRAKRNLIISPAILSVLLNKVKLLFNMSIQLTAFHRIQEKFCFPRAIEVSGSFDTSLQPKYDICV